MIDLSGSAASALFIVVGTVQCYCGIMVISVIAYPTIIARNKFYQSHEAKDDNSDQTQLLLAMERLANI